MPAVLADHTSLSNDLSLEGVMANMEDLVFELRDEVARAYHNRCSMLSSCAKVSTLRSHVL